MVTDGSYDCHSKISSAREIRWKDEEIVIGYAEHHLKPIKSDYKRFASTKNKKILT